jgi:parallel beta-helix repeat protein
MRTRKVGLTGLGVLLVILLSFGLSWGQLSCTGTVFDDVNATAMPPAFCGFIEQFSALGITGGCSATPPLYCPDNPVTRAQMAIFLTTVIGPPSTRTVTCPGESLQAAVGAANPGDTINVTGTCSENVTIDNKKINLTLDGQNVATINGPDSGIATLIVRGTNIVIRNFEITGGASGVFLRQGAEAVINNNNIHNTTRSGISMEQSFAAIKSNNIHNNPGDGIFVSDNSAALIGVDGTNNTSPSPNTIQNNGNRGIVITRTSNARIVSNIISGNTNDGIVVARASQADIASNTINSNGGNGISVSQNSGIELGEDNPVTFYDQPNVTTVNNVNFGIGCSLGGYVKGHLGSVNQINGVAGQTSIAGNCPLNLVTP